MPKRGNGVTVVDEQWVAVGPTGWFDVADFLRLAVEKRPGQRLTAIGFRFEMPVATGARPVSAEDSPRP